MFGRAMLAVRHPAVRGIMEQPHEGDRLAVLRQQDIEGSHVAAAQLQHDLSVGEFGEVTAGGCRSTGCPLLGRQRLESHCRACRLAAASCEKSGMERQSAHIFRNTIRVRRLRVRR